MRGMQKSILQVAVTACLAVTALGVTPADGAGVCTGENTCFGEGALQNDGGDGSGNSAFGFRALYSNSIVYAPSGSIFAEAGSYNTAVGAEALSSSVTGFYNTAVGAYALFRSTSFGANTAIGAEALYANTTGGNNTATGAEALYANTTGYYNTASGHQALKGGSAGITGNYNTASGSGALFALTTGSSNVATGAAALYRNTAGASNAATGANALYSNTTGNFNTANGNAALRSATTGYRNVALGYQAGYAVTTGGDNIIIGGGNQGTSSDAGVIRIGTSAYQKRAFVAGIRAVKTGVADAVPVLIDSKGQLGTVKSSRRFKEDIQPMGSVSERLFALRPVTFRYRQAYEDGSRPVQFGLVAEEVAAVFPELVVYDEDGKPETVAYHVLATLLLNELQKDHLVIRDQSEQLAALRQTKDAQAVRMAALEQQVAILAKAMETAARDRMVASTR